jgi:hypothetical protein
VKLQQEALAAKGLPLLPVIASLPGTARWSGQRLLALTVLGTMRDEMQAYYEDRTERWQESDRGQAMAERLDDLDAIFDSVDSFEVN